MAKKTSAAPQPPDVLALRAIEEALQRYSCALVAVPSFVQDGRGGWVITTRIDVVKK